ncbi:uncharacterized protein CEXT_623091 [Caerostris extrusa]|uniref:Uncharacterized protein n=1 Tax=Caerostris extrusa TaxID=172846 RepID=A0AAV4N2Y0_CAEEX|nr:uncharacterized protein CEXT_623091 [Caerostris extrusa]
MDLEREDTMLPDQTSTFDFGFLKVVARKCELWVKLDDIREEGVENRWLRILRHGNNEWQKEDRKCHGISNNREVLEFEIEKKKKRILNRKKEETTTRVIKKKRTKASAIIAMDLEREDTMLPDQTSTFDFGFLKVVRKGELWVGYHLCCYTSPTSVTSWLNPSATSTVEFAAVAPVILKRRRHNNHHHHPSENYRVHHIVAHNSPKRHHPNSEPGVQDKLHMPPEDEVRIENMADLDLDLEYEKPRVRVPITLCLLILIGYISGGAVLFSLWEGWGFLDGSYFFVS